jgi:hypothetical protein
MARLLGLVKPQLNWGAFGIRGAAPKRGYSGHSRAGFGRQRNIEQTHNYLSVCLHLSIADQVGGALVCGLGPCYFPVFVA